ncbi:hypothetical protein [Streptomyces sp. NPDC001985]|uniref:hypothetical protein n=1 Tax=Streptomyces sp. NPDC001985 TaxID=3154406 RepID=UPI003332B7B2
MELDIELNFTVCLPSEGGSEFLGTLVYALVGAVAPMFRARRVYESGDWISASSGPQSRPLTSLLFLWRG